MCKYRILNELPFSTNVYETSLGTVIKRDILGTRFIKCYTRMTIRVGFIRDL